MSYNAASVISVKNVAALRTIPFPKQYTSIDLQGYYAANDNGGGSTAANSYSQTGAGTLSVVT